MTYPGSKTSAHRTIINLIPPHRVYIEAFAGMSAIALHKLPAAANILIEKDPIVHQKLFGQIAKNGDDAPNYTVVNADALEYLARYPFQGDEFVYCDPPYLLETRRQHRQIYRYELSAEDHEYLLHGLIGLPCKVMISGYWSQLYEDYIGDWTTITYQSMTRSGSQATEYLWINYPEPTQLHEYTHIGADFRERERIKRKRVRRVTAFKKLPYFERQAQWQQMQQNVASDPVVTWPSHKLILSLFPGIGLLDQAFEQLGFCVVRGPDLLWGGDIRHFHPPKGIFWGVIGGSPCQDFSRLRRDPPTEQGLEMLSEFARCVTEASPEWWLLENVDRVPDIFNLIEPDVYDKSWITQRFDINQAWYSTTSRLRHIQFGSKAGRLLNVTRQQVTNIEHTAVVANDDRSFSTLCHLQGLPSTFDLPGFTLKEKKRVVGNGVPLPMGRALARAILDAYAEYDFTKPRCVSCGREARENSKYCEKSNACRKRESRRPSSSEETMLQYRQK